MKFTLDITLPVVLNGASADAAAGHRLAEAGFAARGVAAIYGVNDFVTATRQPGFDWDPIVAAVLAAADATCSDRCPADPSRRTSTAVTYAQRHSNGRPEGRPSVRRGLSPETASPQPPSRDG
jgi:Scaffold protein Nfu/NifU N terminal